MQTLVLCSLDRAETSFSDWRTSIQFRINHIWQQRWGTRLLPMQSKSRKYQQKQWAEQITQILQKMCSDLNLLKQLKMQFFRLIQRKKNLKKRLNFWLRESKPILFQRQVHSSRIYSLTLLDKWLKLFRQTKPSEDGDRITYCLWFVLTRLSSAIISRTLVSSTMEVNSSIQSEILQTKSSLKCHLLNRLETLQERPLTCQTFTVTAHLALLVIPW